MNNATLSIPAGSPLKLQMPPSAGILGEARNVVTSALTMFSTALCGICPLFLPRGDGARISPARTLLATPGGRERFKRILRQTSNHLQILCAEYQSITQPPGTFNFLERGTAPIAGEIDQYEVRLVLPAQCAVGDRAAVQRRLDEFSMLLREQGFVAYKDSHILLNPRSHFGAVIFYDPKLGKFCVHIRDTASDRFWESGSWRNWIADCRQGAGLLPEVYAIGNAFVNLCVQTLGAENILLTGYSMGGGIATFAGIRNSVEVLALNSAYLSPAQWGFFPDDWLTFADGHVQFVSTGNDMLSLGLDDPRGCRQMPSTISVKQRICTAARKDDMFLQ
jgi:hypothetical protein